MNNLQIKKSIQIIVDLNKINPNEMIQKLGLQWKVNEN